MAQNVELECFLVALQYSRHPVATSTRLIWVLGHQRKPLDCLPCVFSMGTQVTSETPGDGSTIVGKVQKGQVALPRWL